MIRDARPEEATALAALQRRASRVWEEDRAALDAHPDAISAPDAAIADGRVRAALGGDGLPLGFAILGAVDHGECELDALFVEPDAFGRGLGRQLLEDAAERARAAGATRLFVVSGPGAQGFYAKHGFRLLDTVPTRFGPALQMLREL